MSFIYKMHFSDFHKHILVATLILLLSLKSLDSFAQQIVGADISMEVNSDFAIYNRMIVTLNLYVANAPSASFEETLSVSRKTDTKPLESVLVQRVGPSKLLNSGNPKCVENNGVKIFHEVYVGEFYLNTIIYKKTEGHFMIYDGCCRYPGLDNIANPSTTPISVILDFPPAYIHPFTNSSPTFLTPNVSYICKNDAASIMLGAKDGNGDELRYSLIDPLGGFTTADMPYSDELGLNKPNATWATGFNKNNQIKGSPSMKIDSKTGVLSVTSSILGLFTVSILVEEFRNGVKIGSNRREVAINVIDCTASTVSKPIVKKNGVEVNKVELCIGSSTTLETDNNLGMNFQWQKNGQNIPNENSFNLTVVEKGVYNVIKSDKNTCLREAISDKVEVIDANPAPVIKASKEWACGTEDVKIELVSNPSGTSVDWYSADNRLNIIAPFIIVNNDSRISAKFVSPNSCGQLFSNEVQVIYGQKKPSLVVLTYPNGYKICPDELIEVGMTNNEALQQYKWYKNNVPILDGYNPTMVFSDNGIYKLEVSEGSCEKAIVEFNVTYKNDCPVEPILQLYYPQVFTPNGDGINDNWVVYNLNLFPDFEIFIYDRWGKIIFHSLNDLNPWDGKSNGIKVPAGNYPFKIKRPGEQDVTGSIEVLY
ncbi:T9SS type B sorting domain-containing protein [Lacihabitans lacunae]|uniref:T9SS type B sorting domain-containing protein n=1 Tax=Lacihabitans lacunae TaxID=1028214 RepID=A0ABV7YZT6_9BACT